MQTVPLPFSTIEVIEIEKLYHSLLWGEKDEDRKIHNVSWERV